MKLLIQDHALKLLRRMPRSNAVALRGKLRAFAEDPNAKHPWAKAFGPGVWRIRHRDWRAVYETEAALITVLFLKIANRKEVYR